MGEGCGCCLSGCAEGHQLGQQGVCSLVPIHVSVMQVKLCCQMEEYRGLAIAVVSLSLYRPPSVLFSAGQ